MSFLVESWVQLRRRIENLLNDRIDSGERYSAHTYFKKLGGFAL